MNIVMVTNTYFPHVGGVARSVESFSREYRRQGHRVLVVAPEFADMPPDEADVVRIPAIQNFNGSDFSVVLPVSGLLTETLNTFRPDIVHAHHPYLLGMTALRIARYRELPLVFTHHTLYEQYTHYVPGDSPLFRRFVIELATRYANLADRVFAPSESIAGLLHERNVRTSITVVPTGVNVERFTPGDCQPFRSTVGLPAESFVVGHVGRLAPEKNLEFLTQAVAAFLKSDPQAHFLIAGTGPAEADIRAEFDRLNLSDRLHIVGILGHSQLVQAYRAMDVFAFSSQSETQGMVLTEAMAAGVPVVALDGAGVREVVKEGGNGRLLNTGCVDAFSAALKWIADLPLAKRQELKQHARQTAESFAMPHTASKALACYEALRKQPFRMRPEEFEQWERVRDLIRTEWSILKGVAGAAGSAIRGREARDSER